MGRIPTPYDRVPETPEILVTKTTGSNNSTRARLLLLGYRDKLCLQVEDQVGGGEQWLTDDEFADLVTKLTDALALRGIGRG